MSSLLLTSSRLSAAARVAVATAAVQSRAVSGQGIVAAEKLRNALEEYRLENYDREVPSRFKKDILKAAMIHDSKVSSSNGGGGGGGAAAESVVAMDSLKRVLGNIHMENCLTQQEMQALFEELGNGKEIPAQNIIKFI
jgi:hypothetical protein